MSASTWLALIVAMAAFPALLLAALLMNRRDLAAIGASRAADAPAEAAPPYAPPIPPPPDLFPAPGVVERIGLILVHGIGEQTRFEHLDSQLRGLLRALEQQKRLGHVERMTVEIVGSGVAALHAQQESWMSGRKASVLVAIRHTLGGTRREARIFVHEVWWADVNERYSLAKQIRFWLWGLAIWAHPARLISTLGSASDVRPPVVPNRDLLRDRLRLYLTGVFFALLGCSVGLVSFFAERVLRLQSPLLLRTVTNYISAVKLYNQQRRYAPGLIWRNEEFLDTLGEPPRVSVRRRMIRTIADVACANYHRWYVLAHSQGSVVAFNGLMETAYAWPGYLDEKRWERLLRRGMAGAARPGYVPPAPDSTMPRRPAWAASDAIVYRARVFRRCCGWLTYGSPLEKFAGIWPALVPISKEPAFHEHAVWLNVYDALDPVSGRLLAYQSGPHACCPPALDYGYNAHWALLVTHLHYLTRRLRHTDVATQTATWMLTGAAEAFAPPGDPLWYRWGSDEQTRRRSRAWASWVAAAIVLWLLGPLVLAILARSFTAWGTKMLWVADLVLWLPLLIGIGGRRTAFQRQPAPTGSAGQGHLVLNAPADDDARCPPVDDTPLETAPMPRD